MRCRLAAVQPDAATVSIQFTPANDGQQSVANREATINRKILPSPWLDRALDVVEAITPSAYPVSGRRERFGKGGKTVWIDSVGVSRAEAAVATTCRIGARRIPLSPPCPHRDAA